MKYIQDFFESRRQYGITPGLERMQKLLEEFDHPEQTLKIIHIAGTNGKGSTQTFLQHGLMANGFNVGTFSSPALEDFTEQIKVNNIPIAEGELEQQVEKIKPVIKRMDARGDHPTEFEVSVLMALLYMQKKTDIAIIEAGMGGEEDATNCVSPFLSIITNVEKDHMTFLGKTYPEIAAHKAGIIKHGVPVITGNLQKQAEKVVAETAIQRKSPYYRPEKAFIYQKNQLDNGFKFKMENWDTEVPQLRMAGAHQTYNAALAMAAFRVMEKEGWKMDKEKAAKAISMAVLPGRFELVQDRPHIIVDSAHNPAGISSLIKTVRQYFPYAKKHLLLAAFQDKDLTEMTADLHFFETVIFTTFSHPRAAPADVIAHAADLKNKKTIPDWKTAIRQLQSEVPPEDIILVTGSLNFIGKVRQWIRNEKDWTTKLDN